MLKFFTRQLTSLSSIFLLFFNKLDIRNKQVSNEVNYIRQTSNGVKQYLAIAQIIAAALLIVFILFQQRGTALGSAFGGEGGFYATRRGIQKKIFWLTCLFGALFIILAVLNLIF